MSTLALAVDFGGTKVEAALVDDRGVIVESSRFREPTGRDATSDQLAERAVSVVQRALAASGGREVIGAGVGTAGPITVSEGLISPLNVPVWRDFPFRDLVRDASGGLPVTLRMDGEAITMAEHWIGAGQGVDNLMGMVVSTGIGGGLILNGTAVAGPTGNAGHIGHLEVGGFDDPCLCGGIGCLEAVASGPNTVRWARSQGFTGETGEDLAAAAAAGDPIANAAVHRVGRALGQTIAAATALVDLELVAIGGGFSKVSPDLFGIIRDTIQERAHFPFVAKVKVVPSALSGDGPLIGAAALVLHSEHVS